MPTTLIFDFDGTLADTFEISINIFNQIASEFGLQQIQEKDIKKFRSDKPQKLLKEYGISNLKLLKLLLRVRQELKNRINQIQPIQGMPQVLQNLKQAGFNLGIMTSNSEENVELFLQNNHLNHLFDFCVFRSKYFWKR